MPPPPPPAAPPVFNKTVGVEISGTSAAPNFEFSGGDARDRIRFNNNGSPGVIVYFKINDGGTGLRFPPDARDALSVDLVAGNPPAGPLWPGFVPLSVENNQQKLLVYCRNEVQNQEFKFTLHFVGPQGPKSWDPIGDGLNGPRGGF
jgi:hypothetical protein